MMAEGIGRGHAVFLPAFTYTATAEVPLVLGATPVFVDVDPRSFQIDPEDLRRRIASVRAEGVLRPRALVGVDLFGQPAPWPALREIARPRRLFLLDDCAQSFGASLAGRKLGAEADATAISFFPSKPLGGYGDGGALLTDRPSAAALYRSLRTHGEGTTRYEVLRTGMNGRLDTLQAGDLLAKLDVFEAELAARERIAGIYDAALAGRVPSPPGCRTAPAPGRSTPILLADERGAGRVQAHLRAAGVPTAIYYPRPLHHQPAYAPHPPRRPVAGVGGSGDAHPGLADPPRSERGAGDACGRGRAARQPDGVRVVGEVSKAVLFREKAAASLRPAVAPLSCERPACVPAAQENSMSNITKGKPADPALEDKDTGTRHGVPAGAATQDSPGGYGGTDRLQSETGPLQPDKDRT